MITYATNEDLAYIKSWLEEEYAQEGEGFWVNWKDIEHAHQIGQLLVSRDGDKPIAFHNLGDILACDSIMVVHPNRRGCGVGTALATHIIEKARAAGVVLMTIDCKPTTSKRFFKKLGFQLVEGGADNRRHFAYMPLEKPLLLPAGDPAVVVIKYFEADSTKLISEHRIEGRELGDGSIALARRAIGFSNPTSSDIGVSVTVNGQELVPKARAKYLEDRGFINADGAFYIDRVLT